MRRAKTTQESVPARPGLRRARVPAAPVAGRDPAQGAPARRVAGDTAGPSLARALGGRAPAPGARKAAPVSPEDMLARAIHAPSARSRGIWARRGLSSKQPLDRTTQAMLLRQLYLSHYEQRHFRRALELAKQVVELGVLPDVAHQDAARACQALGDIDAAAMHLRLAARKSPPKRKAFHWWTLGSLYFLARRYDEAISNMTRAARWGTTDKPLYQGHLAVVRCASGDKVADLASLIERLSEVPAGQGYGRFVLGQMAFYGERWEEAKRYLEAFVRRSTGGRPVLAIALDGEIEVARQTLARMA